MVVMVAMAMAIVLAIITVVVVIVLTLLSLIHGTVSAKREKKEAVNCTTIARHWPSSFQLHRVSALQLLLETE